MRLHRFFIDEKVGDQRELHIPSEKLIHQWRNVFRFEPGCSVILNDDSGYDYEAVIDSLNKNEANVRIVERRENKNVPSREIYLFVSLTKKDTFEWVLEKATELGVSRIIPIISERSEKKAINFERAKKIIREAAEQSGRAVLPRLYEVMNLADALSQYEVPSIAWHPEAEIYTKQNIKSATLACYIGPEGGWSPREISLFVEHKVPVVSLGAAVLRTETASIATLALLLF